MSFPPCPSNWSKYNDDELIDYLQKNIPLTEIAGRLHVSYAAVSSRISTIIYHLYRTGHYLSSIKETINLSDDEIKERIYINLNSNDKQKYDIRMLNYKLDILLGKILTEGNKQLPIQYDKYYGLFDKK